MAWHYEITNRYGSQTGWGTNEYDNYIITQNQIDNATEMWNFFRTAGYTEQATAAIIGNAMWESLINPAQYEYYTDMNNFDVYGMGLLMWTPKRKIRDYAANQMGDMYDGYLQCQFYLEDVQRVGAWNMYRGLNSYPNYPYIMTADEFKNSTQSASYLGEVFGCNYEGGTYSHYRGDNSNYWFNYFSGTPPTPPTPPSGLDPAWAAVLWYVTHDKYKFARHWGKQQQ